MNLDHEDCAAVANQIDRLSVPSHEMPHLPYPHRCQHVAGSTAAS
jgi:hypothetical protein